MSRRTQSKTILDLCEQGQMSPVMTIKQASEYLNRSRQQIWLLVRMNELAPAFQVGKFWYIDQEAVHQYKTKREA